MKASEIKTMSIAERLKSMEALWDTFLHEEVDIGSPEWHGDILSERKSKIESGEAHFISLDTLRAYRK